MHYVSLHNLTTGRGLVEGRSHTLCRDAYCRQPELVHLQAAKLSSATQWLKSDVSLASNLDS